MPQNIPQLPEQNPGQNPILLPRVVNPYLSVWWSTQSISDVPENVMGWLVAQGYEVSGITQDNTTVPPTNYFSLTKEGMKPLQVLLSLCNSYTTAANEARDANQQRYNEILANWTQMIDTTHDQFNAQTEEQNAQAGVFLTDLDSYMDAIETLIADNQSQLALDAAEAKTALVTMDSRLAELEANAAASAVIINGLLSGLTANVNTYVTEIGTILTSLEADYVAVEAELEAIKISTGNLGDALAGDYQAILNQLESDFLLHEQLAREFLDDLGATELARINEEFASRLSAQTQSLVSRGFSSSALVTDITERNHRDRDEQIQALNDRLMRERLDNQHKLYQQQFAMRARMMDSQVQLHSLQQEVLRYQASLITGTYDLQQNLRNRILAGKQSILAARDSNARLGVQINSTLLEQLQSAFTGFLGGKERFSTLLLQHANTLAEHKHKAIAQRLDTAVKRLAGWQSVADENRKLMAYQIDERNKLLVGLYSFVERREDISPEWKDVSSMIAGLGDAGGGWIQP